MRITAMREIAVPLEGNVANAVVSFASHDVSLVALVSDVVRQGRPVIGYGFNSIGRFAQSGIVNSRMKARVLSADPTALLDKDGAIDPAAIARAAMRDEKPGGHGDRASAVAAIELAAWDLKARLAEEPACATIARAYGRTPLARVPVYAAGGYYYPGEDSAGLSAELSHYRAQGYCRFKMKIGGADWETDARRLDAALAVAGHGDAIAVDANGRFALDDALLWAARLAPYGLRWFEEPGDPLDYQLMAALSADYPGRLATGENLFSCQDAVNLIRHGGMRPGKDIFQMDAGLSYGLTEYARMIAALEAAGHDRTQAMPHGGHLINLHIVAALGLGGCEAYPGVFAPFGGYGNDVRVEDGHVHVADCIGFGLDRKADLKPWLDRLAD